MLCEKCGKNEATVYIKTTVNGQTQEVHLCADCANASGQLKFSENPFGMPANLFEDLQQAFSGFFPGIAAPNPTRTDRSISGVCPLCGASAADIARSGRAGCADCYGTFAQVLGPAIKRIHGDAAHTGAVPGSAGAEIAGKRRLSTLRSQLNTAIQNEEFEAAAKIRDEIREIEGGKGTL